MPKRLLCECGYTATGETELFVADVQLHARTVHAIELEREVVLSLASEDDGLEITQSRPVAPPRGAR